MIDDNEGSGSSFKRWFSSKTLPKEEGNTEVLFEYDSDNDNKNNEKDRSK